MSQNNMRKEPTFGEPSKPTDIIENIENIEQETVEHKAKVPFSIHSTKNPGYTFTPPLTRPAEIAKDFATMEEQKLLNADKPTVNVQNVASVSSESLSQVQATQPHNVAQPAIQATQQTVKSQTAGFAFAPVEEETAKPTAITPEKVVAEKVAPIAPVETPKVETVKSAEIKPEAPVVPPMNTNNVERVIPTQAQPAPAKTSVVDKVPSKYRRLLLVLLLALALLLVFFLLKPKAPETVEQLQQQGTSLPIEFRPVDEEEAKRAEEEARAQQEALAQQQAQEQAAQQPTDSSAASQPTQSESTAPTSTAEATAQQSQSTVAPAPAAVSKPVVIEPVKKPATTGSVIYQPESAKAEPKKVEKAATAPVAKAVPTQAVETKPTLVKAEPVKVVEKVQTAQAPAVKATPSVAKAETVSTPVSAPAAVSSKTMTIPKGVSLMQVFRDNNLNISDVNAMSKVNNVVSNLKVGEKVTVRLDSNNRVAEMRIGSGGKFTRQANGSYTFSK
ncbi:hypothetical protein A1D22_05130 [Pasteurellaceae bacterium LFhippo2]|nr:hypothetical protein [Pasteurellaceae bacterium LFhippo2]